jgi:hypothetical protein
MNENKLINNESAAAYLDEVGDPIISTIMDMFFRIVAMKYSYPDDHQLATDLDLRFLAEVLVELFADRELIKKILDGERLGAWDDEEK